MDPQSILPTQSEEGRVESVREFFDRPENYLGRRRFDIRLRAETTESLLSGLRFEKILDIGCGDGSISIPLLSPRRHLTLVDVSSNMLAAARARVPLGLSHNIRIVNADFTKSAVSEETYDVVICIGVLAHVARPVEFIAKVSSVLRPGGTLILEYSDAGHPLRRLLSFYDAALARIRPPSHRRNQITSAQIGALASIYRLLPSGEYRYSFPWPGAHRIASQRTLYALTKMVFGSALSNRSQWLGSEHVCRFTRV